MTEALLTFRGRNISREDIAEIRKVIETHSDKRRRQLSRILCEQWGWVYPHGGLKDQYCRMLLVRLERAGHIKLPAAIHSGNNEHRQRNLLRKPELFLPSPLEGRLGEVGPVSLVRVSTPAAVQTWWDAIQTHHYLGGQRIVGSKLYYLAYVQGQLVAALGWGMPAWAVAARDRFIGWDGATRRQHLRGIVNNVRFLILPGVRVKYLASHLLARSAQILASEWMAVHGYPIYLLETFVDSSRFKGTCYRAANWVNVGQTNSPVRRGTRATSPENPKTIYCYPLAKDFRAKLMGHE